MSTIKKSFLQNPWRFSFFLLAGFLLILLALLLYVWFDITSSGSSSSLPAPTATQGAAVPIEANVSADAINSYLAMQLAKKESPISKAELSLERGLVRTDTSLEFFGRQMELSMWMRPQVQEDGDLTLVAEDAKVGGYSIPLKTLFAVLEGLPWPPWVHVESEQYTLQVAFSERPGDKYSYRIKKIDWGGEKIQLEILIRE
ncbi:hypothetical protein CBW65_00950 [Tumebacillus avium]|uniref:DUF2140 domain-containing protein n=1 Tax=Tumebacillus avium TaxID=1903704 RepID=A0A1Y0IK86_9BACL|nr:DUF2140 family protein [Tumebacillus avium]ARU59774.1 hypothetical protein CBW65_00950 [Tumebacillus avium]